MQHELQHGISDMDLCVLLKSAASLAEVKLKPVLFKRQDSC